MIYKMIDPQTGKESYKTVEEIGRYVHEELDEAFFSPIFVNHVIGTDKGQVLVLKEEES